MSAADFRTVEGAAVDRQLLLQLRNYMRYWMEPTRRAIGADVVGIDFGNEEGDFSLYATWKKNETLGRLELVEQVVLKQSELFGRTEHLTAQARTIQLPPCNIARRLIEHVLRKRGVL